MRIRRISNKEIFGIFLGIISGLILGIFNGVWWHGLAFGLGVTYGWLLSEYLIKVMKKEEVVWKGFTLIIYGVIFVGILSTIVILNPIVIEEKEYSSVSPKNATSYSHNGCTIGRIEGTEMYEFEARFIIDPKNPMRQMDVCLLLIESIKVR